jgi:site-specific DNA-methyltransferase (adenine-specific)
MKITGKIEITNEDNMALMSRYPDNYFDLAIVDPPYGVGDFNSSKSKYKAIDWNDDIPTSEYFNELHRVSKNQIIWGANYYQEHIKGVGRIVHDKTGGGKKPVPNSLSEGDIASHSFGVTIKMFHYVSNGNVIGNKIDWDNTMRWHPCQKPIALYEWILMNYAKEGDKILDTHLGSGSIAIACHNLGFELTACELDKDYYDASIKRIKNHIAQQRLF